MCTGTNVLNRNVDSDLQWRMKEASSLETCTWDSHEGCQDLGKSLWIKMEWGWTGYLFTVS